MVYSESIPKNITTSATSKPTIPQVTIGEQSTFSKLLSKVGL